MPAPSPHRRTHTVLDVSCQVRLSIVCCCYYQAASLKYRYYRSVVCPSVCMRVSTSSITLVHPAKVMGRMRCHLAGTLVWSQVTLCQTGASVSPREGEIWGSKHQVRSDVAYSQITLAVDIIIVITVIDVDCIDSTVTQCCCCCCCCQ